MNQLSLTRFKKSLLPVKVIYHENLLKIAQNRFTRVAFISHFEHTFILAHGDCAVRYFPWSISRTCHFLSTMHRLWQPRHMKLECTNVLSYRMKNKHTPFRSVCAPISIQISQNWAFLIPAREGKIKEVYNWEFNIPLETKINLYSLVMY